MSLRCSQKTLSLGVGTNCVRSCCMEAKRRRSWEYFSYVECSALYDRVKVTLYDLETELFIVFQLIVDMLYWKWFFWLFLSPFDWNDFVAFDLWTQQRQRRCLANISGLRRLFLSFFLLALAEGEIAREFPICSADRFQFLYLKTKKKKKYFAISWMLVIAPLARERNGWNLLTFLCFVIACTMH